MPFIPNTNSDQDEMLRKIGVNNFEDLLSNIPPELLFKGDLKLPKPMSEFEVTEYLRELSMDNENCLDNICFLGAGAYDHFVPSVVKHILSRSEFYTAYTPYQAEVSQGTLQAIYEYQTMICELTGMDAANASMYDAGSALAEAALLACHHTRRTTIAVSATLNPNYLRTIQTYCRGQAITIKQIPANNGITSVENLQEILDDDTAAVLIQHPNYFGCLEPVEELSRISHEKQALLVTSNDPISLAILQPPGSYGTDIATGEGQSLGNPLNFGGPYLGLFATNKNLLRKLPGRIVGQTVDTNGKQGFVLTLQTREQHIRREKATSNICSNEALNALAAAVYLALLGKQGFKKVADLCLQKSHYLADKINSLEGYRLKFNQPFFKEFVVECDVPAKKVIDALLPHNIFAGVDLVSTHPDLENCLLCAVTEKRTKQQLDYFIDKLRELN